MIIGRLQTARASVLVITLFMVVLTATNGAGPAGATTSDPLHYLTTWGRVGPEPGRFTGVTDVAVDDLGGSLFVADTSNHRIQQFDFAGELVRTWGEYGTADGQFAGPAGVALDHDGNVWVTDRGNNRVQEFSATGQWMQTWGVAGPNTGELDAPVAIDVSDAGEVFLTDAFRRVQVFTEQGAFLRSWGTYGSAVGQMNNPAALVLDGSGHVYVADTENHRVQEFDTDGTPVRAWGVRGEGPGEFHSPAGIEVASNGDVLVADTFNHRLQRFTAEGTYVGPAVVPSPTHPLDRPMGLAANDSDSLFVADNNNERIQVFSPLVVDLVTPADGAEYALNDVVTADYACTDGPGGAPLEACEGTVPDGEAVDTSSAGPHAFTVIGVDASGRQAMVTHHWSIPDRVAPTIDLVTPADGATYGRFTSVTVEYSCSDEGGSQLADCVGTLENGGALPTLDMGDFDFEVTATDNAGNTTHVTHRYTVGDITPPNIELGVPDEGQVFRRGEEVSASYLCWDDPPGHIETCEGDVPDGGLVDTSTTGAHDFTVTAVDVAGNESVVTHTYSVVRPRPDARIKQGAGNPYSGDGVYNTTGQGQSRTASAARGRTVTYTVSIQNDASAEDQVVLRGPGSTPSFAVRYTTGGTVISRDVRRGTWVSPVLAPGSSFVVKVEVTVSSTAPAGASLSGLLTATSAGDTNRADAVRFTTRRG